MKIQRVKIDLLSFSKYNPRRISDADLENLKKAIKEFGLVEPIVVNKDNCIVGGHQRVRACKELGHDEIDVVYVDLDKNKEKVLNLALNRISGDWENAKLSSLILELEKKDLDLGLSGFLQFEIDAMLNVEQEDLDLPDMDLVGDSNVKSEMLTFYFDEADTYKKCIKFFDVKAGRRTLDGKLLLALIKQSNESKV